MSHEVSLRKRRRRRTIPRYCTTRIACDGAYLQSVNPTETCTTCAEVLARREKAKQLRPLRGEKVLNDIARNGRE